MRKIDFPIYFPCPWLSSAGDKNYFAFELLAKTAQRPHFSAAPGFVAPLFFKSQKDYSISLWSKIRHSPCHWPSRPAAGFHRRKIPGI